MRQLNVGIIGCGYVGLPPALRFANPHLPSHLLDGCREPDLSYVEQGALSIYSIWNKG